MGIAVNGSASGESPISASLTQDIVGVYLVAFQVPSSIPSGSNVGFSVSVLPQGSGTVYLQHAGYIPRSIIPSLSVLSWGRPCSAPFLFFAFDSPPINRL